MCMASDAATAKSNADIHRCNSYLISVILTHHAHLLWQVPGICSCCCRCCGVELRAPHQRCCECLQHRLLLRKQQALPILRQRLRSTSGNINNSY
jgi:hypothetical protein